MSELAKRCDGCQETKSLADYYVRNKATGKLFALCKTCHNARTLANYYKNHDYYLQKNQKLQAKKYREDPELARRKQAEWRASNPEASKAIQKKADHKRKGEKRAYRAANAEHIKEKSAEYRAANRERIRRDSRERYAANRELILDRIKQWEIDNPERYRQIHSKWKRSNKGKVNASTHRRRARIAGCKGSFSAEQWELIKATYDYKCLMCERQEPEISLTIDHVVPIDKGEENTIENLQPLCKSCNSKKHTQILDLRQGVNDGV